jgi:hypothetical protein
MFRHSSASGHRKGKPETRFATVLVVVCLVLAAVTASFTRSAEAAPALGIRIGLAWDRWAAQCSGRPGQGVTFSLNLGGRSLWPAGQPAGPQASGDFAPVFASYVVGTAGPAVAMTATDSSWLARSAAASVTRSISRSQATPWHGGLRLSKLGPTWYCLLDPAGLDSDAITPVLSAFGAAKWPAFSVNWPRSPGAPGTAGLGAVAALDGGLAGLAFPAAFPVSFTASDGGMVGHQGKPYRGTIQVAQAGDLRLLSVINRLDIEEYLLGVVPSEMPASWPIEALKAQAVAARTYAVSNLGRHGSRGFDLCFDIHCQAYLGYNNEQPGPSTAVRATAGTVATYNGRLINAVYHAHSGGATDSSAVIWGSAEPYLVGTSRTFEKPYYWTATNSRVEVEKVVTPAFADGVPAGLFPLLSMKPVQFTTGGRATRVDLSGPAFGGQITVSRLRSGLGSYRLREAKFGAWGIWVAGMWQDAAAASSIASLLPVVTWAPGARGEGVLVAYQPGPGAAASGVLAPGPSGIGVGLSLVDPAFFIFSGEGFGHGVGMSQWGAREMAAIGKGYVEILTNFYKGITLAVNYGR